MALRKKAQAKPAQGDLDDLALARAQRGDQAACRALVECYQNRVFALVSRMLRPAGLGNQVEDVAQEVFLKVFRALPRYKIAGEAKFSTWLYTVAHRRCLDELKSPRRLVLVEDAVEGEAQEKTDALTNRNEAKDTLEKALSRVSEEHRSVFLLRAYHELSHEEIGMVLNLPVGTVKSRIARAKAALQDALAEVGDG